MGSQQRSLRQLCPHQKCGLRMIQEPADQTHTLHLPQTLESLSAPPWMERTGNPYLPNWGKMGQMGGWPRLVADLPPLLYHTPQALQSPLETRPLKSVDQEFANWPH